MKKTLIIAMLTAVASCAVAQITNVPTFIRGTMNIQFNSQNSDTPVPGIKDVYTLNINVDDSTIFHGTISDTPQIISGWISKAITQPRSLNYNVDCDVINPKIRPVDPSNPRSVKNIGSLHGIVPISSGGTYNYDTSSLVMDILPMGNSGGGTWKYSGVTSGHALSRPANWMDTLQSIPVTISRSINGRTTAVTLAKYDKMDFRQHILAEGPIQVYQPITVNGEMLYDYVKKCWFFKDFTIQYNQNGNIKVDNITGTIRWVPDPHRASNGLGGYDFDVRVNEPPPNTDSAFGGPSNESDFFTTDTTVPGISGTMKYKDTLKTSTVDVAGDPTGDNATTLASSVTIDLTGNNITRQQTMALFKIIIFSSVVPMNSD